MVAKDNIFNPEEILTTIKELGPEAGMAYLYKAIKYYTPAQQQKIVDLIKSTNHPILIWAKQLKEL